MGRRAQGWKIRWKRGWAYARFTWQKHEYCEALGTTDEREAAAAAARAYADVVSGRRRPLVRRPGQLLELGPLWDAFVDWKRPSVHPETIKTLDIYGVRFLDCFKTLDRAASEASIATYCMARLGQVTRSTVLKERCFLVQFLAWCKVQGAIDVMPPVPPLPPKAKGKRSGHQRAKPVDVTAREAHAIIAECRPLSKSIGGRTWPIRARFAFTWCTMFRPNTISRLRVPENWRPGLKHVVLTDEDDKARYGRDVDMSPEAVRVLRQVAPSSGPIFGDHNFSKELKRAARVVLGPHRGRQFAPYDFRHGHAKAMLDAGAPLRGVSYLLGHIRPTTTDRYTRPDRRAGKEALRASQSGPFPDPRGKHVRKTG